MTTEELWALISRELEEIKLAQRVCNAEVNKINGTVREHRINIKAIWLIFGGAWAVFLIWFREWLGRG